jgi:hypothetical protein
MSLSKRPNPACIQLSLKHKGEIEMKKDLVEMVFILDRSGSMTGLEDETIAGYNKLISRQKELDGEALVSTVLFDHQFDVLYNRKNIQEIPIMTRRAYYVRGSTALLDAIGRSIQKIDYVQSMLVSSQIPEKTIFVITTDGMENSSHEYSSKQIKEMIERQKEKHGWEFIFLGANIDAVETASRYGIDPSRAASYHSDQKGTDINYQTIDKAIHHFRVHKTLSENWKDEIDQDFEKRKK